LRVAPDETDRICKLAERVLRREPKNMAVVARHRSGASSTCNGTATQRELCYLAQQALPPEKHGFVHAALGEMLLVGKQQQSAVNELESALACEDVPLERVIGLAAARRGKPMRAMAMRVTCWRRRCCARATTSMRRFVHLSASVQQDDLLIDLAFELLAEYGPRLESHAPARVLEGLLHLRKGDRSRGVGMLDRALELQPEIAPQVLPALEAEWDRDPQNMDLGLAFSRALRGAGQGRRACRLVIELARRFPDRQALLVDELEVISQVESGPEVHRALWEIQLDRGQRESALEHFRRAVEATRQDPAASRELWKPDVHRMPEAPWVACNLAEIELRGGNPARAEQLLQGMLARDPLQWEMALTCVQGVPGATSTEGMQRIEIDCWLAGRKGHEALEGLRRFRTAHPAARDAVIERYRLLVAQQSTGIAAEHELGTLLREAGKVEECVQALESGLQRAQAVGNTRASMSTPPSSARSV
jgi:tetratricopeptide (TPR) repeat protein